MGLCLWYNPGCGTCRNALALLEEKGEKPELLRYMDTPPSEAELKTLLKKLGVPARELLRTKAKEYTELGLDKPGVSEEKLIAAMCAHPSLIQRPIIIDGNKAIIGRPAEKVLEIVRRKII